MELVPEFKDMPAYHVYGYTWVGSDNSEIPALWKQMGERFAPILGGGFPDHCYGIGSDFQPDGVFTYTIAIDYKEGMLVPDGFRIHDIQPGHYAVFTVPMDAIGPSVGYIYGEWLPASGWKHRGTPEVQIFEMTSHATNSMQILVPVEPVA